MRREQGFTLIEMMITVVVIGILAAVVVPMFTRETRKSKGSSETTAVMGELAVREEQYKLENGAYLPAAACPSTPSTAGQDASSCLTTGQPWNTLRVRLPQNKLHCSYEVVTGAGTGTTDPLGFTFSSPEGSWFYIVATCDMDGQTGTNSTYFMSSVSSEQQVQNEGS
jgi:prepilin-type N-terminal cleavage/methylation domain-containing protein